MTDDLEPIAGLNEAETKMARYLHDEWCAYVKRCGGNVPDNVTRSLFQIAYEHWLDKQDQIRQMARFEAECLRPKDIN